MAAYRRVYDSRHLQADCQEPGPAREPYARYRVWATFTFYLLSYRATLRNPADSMLNTPIVRAATATPRDPRDASSPTFENLGTT